MQNCDGDGFCLKQCWCECFDEIDEDTDVYNEICTCGHREHNGFCPSTCTFRCSLKECRYFSFCNEKRPEFLLNCHFGMCVNCEIQTGPHTLTDQVKECFICFEEKTMIQLKCDHQMCKECWFKITRSGFGEESDPDSMQDPKCPMCRRRINWSREDGEE